MPQKKRRGKVIKYFTVEVVAAETDPALCVNPSNPYLELSDEERMRDLVDTFSILWAQSCQEKSRNMGVKQS